MPAVSDLLAQWQAAYRASDILQLGLHAAHLGAIAVAGISALAADRELLRLQRRPPALRRIFLAELPGIHRRVLGALMVAVASGSMLLLADLATLLPSPVFWLKMAALGTLLWNGARLRRAAALLGQESPEPEPVDPSVRTYAARSVGLWSLVVVLGVLLTTVR